MSAMGDFGIYRQERGIPASAPITRQQVDEWRRSEQPRRRFMHWCLDKARQGPSWVGYRRTYRRMEQRIRDLGRQA